MKAWWSPSGGSRAQAVATRGLGCEKLGDVLGLQQWQSGSSGGGHFAGRKLCSCDAALGDAAEVGADALSVDVSARRGEVLADGDHKGGAILQLVDTLDQALPIRPVPTASESGNFSVRLSWILV
jgi:hypothetical protein